MTPAKKKATKKKPAPAKAPVPVSGHKQRKPQEILVVSEQPVRITQTTMAPAQKAAVVWSAFAAIRQALFYGFFIGVGLSPIGAHIISQFYCGAGDKLRCNPIEFPAWMEGGGIIVALIFANAAKDVVSKSARQLAEAAKGWLPWAKLKSGTAEQQATPPTEGG
jgi:hypothetical protein